MSEALSAGERKQLWFLLSDFCTIILTDNESISVTEMDRYLSNINLDSVRLLNRVSAQPEDSDDRYYVRCTVQSFMMAYLQNYQDIRPDDNRRLNSPFDFDSSNGFDEFIRNYNSSYVRIVKKNLEKELKDKLDAISGENIEEEDKEKRKETVFGEFNCVISQLSVPKVFNTVFRCIQRISEQYRYFEQFYTIRFQQSQSTILEKTNQVVEETAKRLVDTAIKASVETLTEQAANKAAGMASIKAVELADKAAQNAKRASDSAKKAREDAASAAEVAVDAAVEKKMIDVSTKVSETTVTVLGIFSAIVLTVIGSFIYTSSAVGSAGSVNYFKLISISSLVGLVCFDLLILMFHYIFRIRGGNVTEVTKNWIVILANVLLFGVMLISGIMYFTIHDPNDPEKAYLPPTEAVVTEVQTEIPTLFDPTSKASQDSVESLRPSDVQP